MSAQLTPGEVLAQGPGWDPGGLTIEPLPGGLTNRTFRVRRGNSLFALRLDAPHTAAFDLDRERETTIMRHAEEAGIGPPVVYADPASGVLVTRYLEGPAWSAEHLHDASRIDALARLLQKVHALPLCGDAFDAKERARHYLTRTPSDDALFSELERAAQAVSSGKISGPLSCCHNDVIVENLVGSPPRLLDWEYACDNDAAFDLATLIENHRLNGATARRLIAAYADGGGAALAERVEYQRRLYLRLTLLWFAARGAATSSAADAEQVRALLARIR